MTLCVNNFRNKDPSIMTDYWVGSQCRVSLITRKKLSVALSVRYNFHYLLKLIHFKINDRASKSISK